MKLINLKLTRGDAEHITSDQVWAELGRMWFRRMTGETKPTGPARTNKPAVDVREWVKQQDG